ncbi:MAG: DNA-binding response regulator [Acidiphilium sp. 37-64-53]|jgi:two-component system OmpR family response regulator|uniref:response regulator transcription factor n=1 Tax=Acidiphilium TaxID=522 RepID=UPI000BDB559E|nr:MULTISPECIES: response regulator transcription factor [Acidiphilium]MBW4035304.1 response regulator transcription factor [Pseudomonadota bacterium]MCW8307074.1 response regulator transcription factor [Acidiphilium sp. PA]OYW01353.1 MAG: DNA-binding response regulator [Acidiphilium sp. 37-64-53]OZB24455.1 MAG: DNA-binding response regulator [Acidiphilium sp. 34-64-41]HQT85965.1 response regulator transcription factor [Acidiphilium rubrum]
MRILVIEDDPHTLEFIRSELAAGGDEVTTAPDGRAGLLMAATTDFDAMVVDRMLPQLDGLGVVTALRSMAIATPVIFLTALGRVDERVEGLRAGADDYLVKPFAIEELVARIGAIARRHAYKRPATTLAVHDLTLDRLSQVATRAGQRIELKPREFRLLEFLMLNAGRVVTRTMLLEAVWDFHFDPQTSLVESHVSRIRAKVDRGFDCELIHTVWGVGYRVAHESPG